MKWMKGKTEAKWINIEKEMGTLSTKALLINLTCIKSINMCNGLKYTIV